MNGAPAGSTPRAARRSSVPAFEADGYKAVRTYIQSGNVPFESDAPSVSLEDDLETMLERRFGLPLVVALRSHLQLRKVVDEAPDEYGREPRPYHSDVIFLKRSLSGQQAMRVVDLRDGVDQAWPGTACSTSRA